MIYIETTTTTTTKVTTTTFFFFSLSSSSFFFSFFFFFFFFGIFTYYIIVHFYSSSYLAVRINYYNNPPTYYPRTQDSKDSRTQDPLIRLRSGRAQGSVSVRAQGSGLSQVGPQSSGAQGRGQIKRIFNKKKNIRTHSYTTTGIYIFQLYNYNFLGCTYIYQVLQLRF